LQALAQRVSDVAEKHRNHAEVRVMATIRKAQHIIRDITRRQCFAWMNSQTHEELVIVKKHLETIMAEKSRRPGGVK
jgi:hypothetical protein